ncbi:MAG: hypothetical protein K0R17_1148 [Rariglobus sp.]|jgi:hypothetical protein|nr:hypothetical protein [Rariglobus sp.]
MKSLLIFLLGAVVGAFAYSLYLNRDTPSRASAPAATSNPPPADTRTFGEKAADTTTHLKDSLVTKAQDWHLMPDDIKRELQQGGKIVREKAGVAGGKIADARIITVIKAKYVLDRDLSAMDINVDATNGNVTLTGAVSSVDLVAKAIYHAMDTDGVVNVTSHLTAPL